MHNFAKRRTGSKLAVQDVPVPGAQVAVGLPIVGVLRF